MSVIKDIHDKGMAEGISFMQIQQKAARTWFFNEAKRIEDANPWQEIRQNTEQQRTRPPIIGNMYLYQYNAKHKATLPYWDRYPVMFPIALYDNGFLGINLHYLPIDLRVKLMDALYGLAFNNEYSDEMRLRISYDILKSSAKYKGFKPCIKRYLYSQMRTKYLLIDWKDWSIVAYLPLARWQKQPESVVYAESRKIVNNQKAKKT